MERMSVQDAGFLYVEDDVTPMHVGGVALFEGPPPTREELFARFESKLHLVPRYRQRVHVLPLNLGLPLWVDDQHFTLDYHLRRTAVPSPGGQAELNNLVGRVMSQHLDRARPLWEIWVVEGLDGGRWALVSKVHHCMVDGIAATDLMAVMFDAEPDPAPVDIAEWHPAAPPTRFDVIRHSAGGALAPVQQLRDAIAGIRISRRVVGNAVQSVRTYLPFLKMLRPSAGTSLNAGYGPHRRWMPVRARLDDVKAVRRSLGGTLNDAVLAVITRGFRDLLQGRDEPVEGRVVRTMVPVSVRAENERGELNNRVSAVFVDLPVGITDPVERLEAIRSQMDGLKESQGAVAGEVLVKMAGFAPPMLAALGQRLMTRLPQRTIDTAATNVPGPQVPLYFAGRLLLESSPLIPLAAGVSIVIGIFSYNGTLTFGVTGDYDTAADIDVLCRGIEDGIAELLAAASAAGAPIGSGR